MDLGNTLLKLLEVDEGAKYAQERVTKRHAVLLGLNKEERRRVGRYYSSYMALMRLLKKGKIKITHLEKENNGFFNVISENSALKYFGRSKFPVEVRHYFEKF